jgi:outer membrane protein assembly factor BamB
VRWKTRIRGSGWSSPVVLGKQIWLTSALERGRSLHAICVDLDSGEIVHDVEVIEQKDVGRIHPKNGHASPTAVLEKDRVYVHFGSHGTACLSSAGEILWKTRLPYFHHHGPASTPILVDDLLIVNCDGFAFPFYDKRKVPDVEVKQFVAALDKKTGKVRWKSPRPSTHAYSTPLLIEVDGKQQVVSPGANAVRAYDPRTGAEIWKCRYEGYSVVPRPVFGQGLVFVSTGYDVPSILAIRPDGSGDVTDTHVAWKEKRGAPLNPSPLLVGDELYLVNDAGIVSCLDAKTGKLHWRKRVPGHYSASPLYADGRIYLQSETGTTTILKPGLTFERLAANRVSGRTFASFAVAGHRLLLRSDRYLYCFEKQAEEAADEE